jgi:hypothetical protein
MPIREFLLVRARGTRAHMPIREFLLGRARGTIYNHGDQPIINYGWELGSLNNNEVEAYALYARIKMALSKRIKKTHHLWRLHASHKSNC